MKERERLARLRAGETVDGVRVKGINRHEAVSPQILAMVRFETKIASDLLGLLEQSDGDNARGDVSLCRQAEERLRAARDLVGDLKVFIVMTAKGER